jgi:hypothetical protein
LSIPQLFLCTPMHFSFLLVLSLPALNPLLAIGSTHCFSTHDGCTPLLTRDQTQLKCSTPRHLYLRLVTLETPGRKRGMGGQRTTTRCRGEGFRCIHWEESAVQPQARITRLLINSKNLPHILKGKLKFLPQQCYLFRQKQTYWSQEPLLQRIYATDYRLQWWSKANRKVVVTVATSEHVATACLIARTRNSKSIRPVNIRCRGISFNTKELKLNVVIQWLLGCDAE